VHGGGDAPERAGDARCGGDERRRAVDEAELDTPASRGLVELSPRGRRVDLDLVVREEEPAKRLAELQRVRQVAGRRPAGCEQLVAGQPVRQGRRAREVFLVAVEVLVERVDEVANELGAGSH